MTETEFFTDDAKLIYDLLNDNWSLNKDMRPTMAYVPEAYMMNAREGSIYVYPISRQNSITSMDYRTMGRTSMVGIKLSARVRERYFEWSQEVYRIMLANRRKGFNDLNGYYYIEVMDDRQATDLTGWYSTTFDIKLTTYVKPIVSAGFGKED